MPRFQIVVGTSPHRPDDAAREAERLAAAAGGEQIGIAADVCCGGSPGTDPAIFELLKNIADNIYTCDCPSMEIIGEGIKTLHKGVPPPLVSPAGPTSGALWLVYILIRHP